MATETSDTANTMLDLALSPQRDTIAPIPNAAGRVTGSDGFNMEDEHIESSITFTDEVWHSRTQDKSVEKAQLSKKPTGNIKLRRVDLRVKDCIIMGWVVLQ